MDTASMRNRLHEYIEQADAKHLEAIYTLLEKDIDPSLQYDAATLDMLYKRRQAHLEGNSQTFSAEETIDYIKKHKK